MIGRCIGNSLADLRAESAADFRRYVHLDQVGLVVGRDYPIYGLLFRDGHPWYLICEEEDDQYPKPHFGDFFELIDDRVPPDWSLALDNTNVGSVALLPTSWANDPSFLEKLVDEVPGAIEAFEEMKRASRVWHAEAK